MRLGAELIRSLKYDTGASIEGQEGLLRVHIQKLDKSRKIDGPLKKKVEERSWKLARGLKPLAAG